MSGCLQLLQYKEGKISSHKSNLRSTLHCIQGLLYMYINVLGLRVDIFEDAGAD